MSGDNSYRIKTVLKDNSIEYSLTKTVNFASSNNGVQAYANTNSDVISVDLDSYTTKSVYLFLYDNLGQLVSRQNIKQVTEAPVNIDTLDLEDGQYDLYIVAENTKPILKSLFIRN